MTPSPTATAALCIAGGPRSGKTGTLVERAAAWAEAVPAVPGARPSFLFFCASPVTVDEASERLSQRGLASTSFRRGALRNDKGDDSQNPRELDSLSPRGERRGTVATPFDYACHILADPLAQQATGRGGRVLSRAEEAVFYEDLKTCGLKRRRLRELWAFLLCGLANLSDSDPNWIQTTEEQAILDLARDILAFEGAILPGEVVNLAVRALETEPTLRQHFGSPVVLADDYLLMSRASQRLVNLLAADKIAVAGNEDDALPAFEPYPCPTGFAEFEKAYSPLQRVTFEASFPAIERAWKEAPDLPGEMGLIARTIAEELACGTDPRAITVVGTNRTWRTNLQRALASVGIPAAPLGHPALKAPKGDLASTSKEDRERVLRLLAVDHGNAIAWRQWLSFDDALGRSAAVSELRCVAQPQGLNLAEALAALDDDALPGLPAESPFAQSLLAPYREAQRLLREEAPSVSPEPATHPTPAVAIAAPEDLFGHTFEAVIFGGFVNGFIPSRDMCDPGVIVGGARARQETTDRAAIALAEQRTTRRLLFTSFESCDLETAERLRLHIPRIRLRNGVRTCDIEPSSYLQELNLNLK